MTEIDYLKSIKIKHLPKEELLKLKEVEDLLSVRTVFDPEGSLADFYKQLKKEKSRTKAAEKRLKEAEDIILAMAGVLHHGEVKEDVTRKKTPRGRIPRHPAMEEDIEGPKKIKEEVKEWLMKKSEQFAAKIKMYLPLRKTEQYDVLFLACSDARNVVLGLDNFIGRRIGVIYNAGNIYPDKNPEAKAAYDKELSKLKKGGLIIILGHSGCGAVAAKAHEHEYARKSPFLAAVLKNVDTTHNSPLAHNDCEDNIVNQAEKLRTVNIVRENGIKVISCIFDFIGGNGLEYLGNGNAPKIFLELRTSAEKHLGNAREAGKDLHVHRATAITFVDTSLPLPDPGLVFRDDMNDVFHVSVVDGKFDAISLGSGEYGALKLTDQATTLANSREIAEKMEREARLRSAIIRKMAVSTTVFNSETGKVEF